MQNGKSSLHSWEYTVLVTVYRSDYVDKVAKTQRNKRWCTNLSYVGNLYELFN